MHPRRPDSAKTQLTKQTLDSQATKRQHNSSKFSQTFSIGGSSFHEKPDEFKQYVAEKDKDPKFKHLKSKLEVIQQKTQKKQESKPSFKPFQRKKEKTAEKFNKKVEEKPEKPQQQLNLSRGFAQKTKVKMNSLKVSQRQVEEKNSKVQSKVNFDSFKVNNPQTKKSSNKQIKISIKRQEKENGTARSKQESPNKQERVQANQNGKCDEEINRENELKSLQQYVSDVQARNLQVFPRQYDRMVSASLSNAQDLQKIDLNNFLDQPTEMDFQMMQIQIKEFDQKLQSGKEEESINLDSILKDSATQQDNEAQEDEESVLQSMSASQLKKRNAFLTEVLAGKISKKQIDKLEQMDKSAVKMHRIEREKEQNDDELQLSEINMMKRQSNRLMEKNRLEAAGQLYKDCDYLSEQHKKRLEQLLEGETGDSPFDCNELQSMRRRRIDQGIYMYRQMNSSQQVGQILDEATLPKDPELKRQAEKKVLKEKINSVNKRLSQVNKIAVTKAKINALIKQFQFTKRSESYNQLFEQQKKKYQQNLQKIQQAEMLLSELQEKENINEMIGQIDQQYLELQLQIKRITELDQKKLKQMEKERLRTKLKELEEVSRKNSSFEEQIREMERIKEDVQQKVKVYDQIQNIELPDIHCEGYQEQETLSDLDQLVTRKWKEAQKNPSQLES